jgi:hypothetical protein
MRIRAWGPLFALIALFAAGLTGMALQYHAQQNDQVKPAKSENRNGPNRKIVAVATPEPDNAKAKEKHNAEESFKVTDWLLVLFNGLLALYTWRLYLATYGLVGAATEQSKDTKASIAVAEKSLIAAHRPWIKAKIDEPNVLVDIAPGPEQRGITTLVPITFRNIGKSPAQRIRITAEPVRGDIEARQRELCERHRVDRNRKGTFIFPDGEWQETIQANEPFAAGQRFNAITIAVCIAYDSPVSDRTHITSFVVTFRAKYEIGPLTEHRQVKMGEMRLERHLPRAIADRGREVSGRRSKLTLR